MKHRIKKILILICIAIFMECNLNIVKASNNTTTNTSSNITSTAIAGTSNAKLSNLGTKQYDFTGFKPDETSYDVTIPENITEVEVYAKTQDSKATYKVTGDKNLKIGENKVTITVTASDGKTTKEYYINVRRLGDPSKNPVETPKEEKKEEEQVIAEDSNQSNMTTRYSEPHTETGWYIIGISLAIITVALIVFIIIDDYKPEKKAKKSRKHEYYEEDEQQENFEEMQEQSRKTYNLENDSQATRVINLDEIKSMKIKPNTKGKHF